MNVFDLFAKIGLDSAGFQTGLSAASTSFNSFADLTKKVALGVTEAAVKLGVNATKELASTFVSLTNETADYGDTVDKMSQKMGLSTEAYQEWDAVMQHSGTSMESLKMSMKTLASAAQTGKDSFDKLGISQEQIAKMSQEELFSATITALQNVENETERTYLAGQLLGRGATELGALLNTSAEETQAMKDKVHELGGVMSKDAVKASAKFKDNMQDLKTAISGFKRSVASEFLPGVNTILSGFTDLLSGGENAADEIEAGINQIIDTFDKAMGEGGVISQIIDKLPDLLPVLVDAAVKLFTGIVQAFDKIIAKLEPMLPELIDTIVDGLVKGLPLLIQGGLKLLLAIIQGIADNIDKLVQCVLDMIPVIIDTLIDHLPELVEAGVKIVAAIITGIVQHLPELLGKIAELMGAILVEIGKAFGDLFEKGGEILGEIGAGIKSAFFKVTDAIGDLWDTVTGFFKGVWDEAVSIGENIIEGIVSGFTTAWDTLKGALTDDFFDNWITGFKDIFGIFSPSRVMRDQIGKYLALGIGEGFSEEMKNVTEDMQATIPSQMDFDTDINVKGGNGGGSGGSRTITLVLTDGWGHVIAQGVTSDVNLIQGEMLSLSERGVEV